MSAATALVYSANRIRLDKKRPIRKNKKNQVGISLTGVAHPLVIAEYLIFFKANLRLFFSFSINFFLMYKQKILFWLYVSYISFNFFFNYFRTKCI